MLCYKNFILYNYYIKDTDNIELQNMASFTKIVCR
jgi:hypothetical protein